MVHMTSLQGFPSNRRRIIKAIHGEPRRRFTRPSSRAQAYKSTCWRAWREAHLKPLSLHSKPKDVPISSMGVEVNMAFVGKTSTRPTRKVPRVWVAICSLFGGFWPASLMGHVFFTMLSGCHISAEGKRANRNPKPLISTNQQLS